jgi:hypothetical protein
MDVPSSLVVALGATCALLTGCATAPRTASDPAAPEANAARVASAARSPGQVCRLERPTGSRVLTRVCRTPQEIAGSRQAAREVLPVVVPSGRNQPPYTTR